MKPKQIKLSKPSYVDMYILDLSKTLMYEFHYNYMMKKYKRDKVKLLFTDTDSLMYHIKTEDIFEDLFQDRDLLDNSDYPETSKYFSKDNKKVIGKFKDEASGKPIIEFIGLKSKMYSYKTEDKNNKTAKGVKKNIIKKEISHSDYQDVLTKKTLLHHQMKSIRSDCYQISSYEINKISLSCFDDKRYLLLDGITSYAYGHSQLISIHG